MEAQALQSPPVIEERAPAAVVAPVRQPSRVWKSIVRAAIFLFAIGVGLFLALIVAIFLGLIPFC
jgi:hypothetical protein